MSDFLDGQRRAVWTDLDKMFAEDPRLSSESRISGALIALYDSRKLNAEEVGSIFAWLTARALRKAP